jgi:uncharacterized membrane protein
MPASGETLTAIGVMALVVYLSRAGGYLVGLQVRHIGGLRPVLESLPGCALMAILAPAAWNGSPLEMIALCSVILLMWLSDSVVLATVAGLGILLGGNTLAEFAVHLPG